VAKNNIKFTVKVGFPGWLLVFLFTSSFVSHHLTMLGLLAFKCWFYKIFDKGEPILVFIVSIQGRSWFYAITQSNAST